MQNHALQDRIVKALAAGPATSTALVHAVGISEGVVLLSLWHLQTEGCVTFREGAWSLKEEYRFKFYTKQAG